jgi:hypothetical protein
MRGLEEIGKLESKIMTIIDKPNFDYDLHTVGLADAHKRG